jgi:hypothetical protein
MNNLTQDIDAVMDRVSLLLAYQEEALRELLRQGVTRKEMGMAELGYREVFRDVMSTLDRM